MSSRFLFSVFCLLIIVLVQGLGDNKDPFLNDLAKVCRPLDRNLDLLFVLDGSGSTGGRTFDTQKKMVQRIIDVVDISPNKTKIAILQYSGYTRMEWDFGEFQSKQELKDALIGVNHISGTTKTGKALEKAVEAFTFDHGARLNNPKIAQVAIVVSDGHSHDDPIPAANALRKLGVTLMTVGIGEYVNMNELVDIAASQEMAFRNDSLDDFVKAFSKIAIGEECEFAKGPNGAQISCLDNSIDIDILTTKPFEGHLYVPRFFGFQGCTAKSSEKKPNSISLSIPLNRCGIQKQFLFNPRGLLFETSVILKFHPDYHTEGDKTFPVRCFYPDHRKNENALDGPFKQADSLVEQSFSLDEFSRTENSQNKDVSLVSSHSVPLMELPCSYNLRRDYENKCLLENLNVGDTATHMWECDQASIGKEYGMLVHSCYMTDGLGKELQVLDNTGCSLDEIVMPTPTYLSFLEATTRGGVVKFADHPMMQFRCSLKFCNKFDGECDLILPPRCENNPNSETFSLRQKRQVPANLPPQLMQRLFARRKFYEQEAAKMADKTGDIRTGTVNTHAVVEGDPLESGHLSSDGLIVTKSNIQDDLFETDSFGVPVLQTLKPMIEILPAKPSNLKPAYPINQEITQTLETTAEQLASTTQSSLPANSSTERVAETEVTPSSQDSLTVQSTVKNVELKLLDQESDNAEQIQETDEEPESDKAEEEEPFTEASSVLEESTTSNTEKTLAAQNSESRTVTAETTTDFPFTVGTTPWQWIQINGRWVREGVRPVTETQNTKTEKPPQWVFVDGQWVFQDFSIDDAGQHEVQMFEERHKTDQVILSSEDRQNVQEEISEGSGEGSNDSLNQSVDEQSVNLETEDKTGNSSLQVEESSVDYLHTSTSNSVSELSTGAKTTTSGSSGTTSLNVAVNAENYETSEKYTVTVSVSPSSNFDVQDQFAPRAPLFNIYETNGEPKNPSDGLPDYYSFNQDNPDNSNTYQIAEENTLPVDYANLPVEIEILTVLQDTEEELTKKMNLQGLSRSIVSELRFGEVELSSQIVMVHEREDLNRRSSFVNWCPRT